MSVDETERARMAREVVALGEELFELALRGYGEQESQADTEGDAGHMAEETQAYPVEELRKAAAAFVRVLRALLGVEE